MKYRASNGRPLRIPDPPEEMRVRDDVPRQLFALQQLDVDAHELVENLDSGCFPLLGATQRLGKTGTDWRLGAQSVDRLWTVTLHYHQWACRLAAIAAGDNGLCHRADELLKDYLENWVENCAHDSPGARHLAWNAYAVATRIGAWVALYGMLKEEQRQRWGQFERRFLQSLWRQCWFLHGHLEWDLRGNHLMRDAVGLAWAGRFFEGDTASRWLKTATTLAVDQVREQVMDDGGHFERSPMYHIHVMEDILQLALLLEDREARTLMRDTWHRMAEFLSWVRHPDGEIPLLNDATLNGASNPLSVLECGNQFLCYDVPTRTRRGTRYFPDSGLVACQYEPWTAFFDVGQVGPDYQPGHAHADTLSVECSFAGKRLIVDPGVSGYDNDSFRRESRSTAAHNTVSIDGRDSTELWHIFRVGRRARPRGVQVQWTERYVQAECQHDGYQLLPGRPAHRREIEVEAYSTLRIVDEVTGKGTHSLRGAYLIDPDWKIARVAAQTWVFEWAEHRVRLEIESSIPVDVREDQGIYSPRFGQCLDATRIVWQVSGDLPVVVTTTLESELKS